MAGDWDDTRIPNLIIRGARDYLPPRRARRGYFQDRSRPLMRNKQLGSLFLVSVIDILGFGILIPLVPYMADRFGAAPQ